MQLRFDFDRVPVMPVPPVSAKPRKSARALRGAGNYRAGLMAEDVAERHYRERGYELLERRWRGQGGEIDLIFRLGDAIIFVEVKTSSDFARAAERITRRQMDRICLAACEFCDGQPGGSLIEMRFDAALVDAAGRIDVIENAFGEN